MSLSARASGRRHSRLPEWPGRTVDRQAHAAGLVGIDRAVVRQKVVGLRRDDAVAAVAQPLLGHQAVLLVPSTISRNLLHLPVTSAPFCGGKPKFGFAGLWMAGR